jgi:hypothetical protein
MSLPSLFAIYRRDTESFQFLQAEKDVDGKNQRLKNWAPPDTEHFHPSSAWGKGNRWFVVPTDRVGSPPCIYKIQIHGQDYSWWSLHHMLVWSTTEIYSSASTPAAPVWMESPSILVVEFNNKRIYPREDTSFTPVFLNTRPDMIIDESDKGRYRYVKHTLESLEDDYTTNHYIPPETIPYRQSMAVYKPRSISFTEAIERKDNEWLLNMAFCTASMFGICVLGVYIFIGLEILYM